MSHPRPEFRSLVVCDARITLRLPNVLQEGTAVHLHIYCLDLLLVVDQEHVDTPNPQWGVVALPAPRDGVTVVEHVEGIDARERRLRALAVDEVLLGREADFAQRGALQVVNAVGVVGEVVGEKGLREGDVEVFHCVFEHVDEAVDDGLCVGVGEAELGGCGGSTGSTDGEFPAAREAVGGWPGGWGCDGDAGQCQRHEEGGEMHGVGFLNEWIRRDGLDYYILINLSRGWKKRRCRQWVVDEVGNRQVEGLYLLPITERIYLISARFGPELQVASAILLARQGPRHTPDPLLHSLEARQSK
jgi:hypothetical protein